MNVDEIDWESHLIGGQEEKFEQEYNPFAIPSKLSQAKLHSEAMKVGKPLPQSRKICSCCSMIVEKKPITPLCDLTELSFLGCAFPLYFYLIKECIMMLTVIFIFAGSFTLIFDNQHCEKRCVIFFWFAIGNFDNLETKINSQAWNTNLLAFFFFGIVFFFKDRLFQSIIEFNEAILSPSQYTILVENLPKNIAKKDVADYFFNITKQQVVEVNFAYSLREFKEHWLKKNEVMKKLKSLEQQLHNWHFSQSKKQPALSFLKSELTRFSKEKQELDEKMKKYEEDCNLDPSPKFSGTAFVSFVSQTPVFVLLQNWGVNQFRNLKYLLFNRFFQPQLQFQDRSILIHNAPDPTDLIWENLDFSYWRTLINQLILYGLSILLLIGSFFVQAQIKKIVYEFLQANPLMVSSAFLMKLIALVASCMIVFVNQLLRIIIVIFTKAQKLQSLSKFNQSQLSIYIFLVFFNSAFMPQFVSTLKPTKNSSEQLIWDIHFILLTTAFINPLLKIFNYQRLWKKFLQFVQRKQQTHFSTTQLELNRIFEDVHMDLADDYSFIIITLFLGCWQASIAPLGIIFCLIGLGLNYWIEKYFLTTVYSYPRTQNEDIIIHIIQNLEILAFVYIFGSTTQARQVMMTENLVGSVLAVIIYGVGSVSITAVLIIQIFLQKRKNPSRIVNKMSYLQAKLLFLTDQNRANPVTLKNALKNWIFYLENASETELNQEHRISLLHVAKLKMRYEKSKYSGN